MVHALAMAMTVGSNFYSFQADSIEGKPVPFSEFKGKVVVVVNVASKCGLTPQYAGLQRLYEAKKESGLVVLGFPCNQFAGQEPGTEAEIGEFCRANYGVTFPMFAKVEVNGEGRHPLYAWLVRESGDPADIEWNFAKFLVSRSGKVLGRFSPKVRPEDQAFSAAVEKALAE
jgi:glutathione peroxidase